MDTGRLATHEASLCSNPIRMDGYKRLYERLMGGLSHRAGMRLFRFFSLDPGGESGIPAPSGIRFRLLSEREVVVLCADSALDLRKEAASAAYSRGDLCVGAFDSDELVGYGWLAFGAVPHLDGAWVEFNQTVAWTYKTFVRPSRRGKGIAPALYRFAAAAGREHGRSVSLICVESHNAPSVAAALNAGYAAAGYGGYLLRPTGLRTWLSRAASLYGIGFFLPRS